MCTEPGAAGVSADPRGYLYRHGSVPGNRSLYHSDGAATLGVHGVRHVATASEAASTLAPLPGRWAFEVLLRVSWPRACSLFRPWLGACVYALAGTFGWRQGLSAQAQEAPRFSLAIALVGLAGLGFALFGICALWHQFDACAVLERGFKRAGGGPDSCFMMAMARRRSFRDVFRYRADRLLSGGWLRSS